MKFAAALLASIAIVFANAESMEPIEETTRLFESPHPWIEGFENLSIGMSKQELLTLRPNLRGFGFDGDKIQESHSFHGVELIEPHEPSGAKMLVIHYEVVDSRLVSIIFAWEGAENAIDEQKSEFLCFLLHAFGERFDPMAGKEGEKAVPLLTWPANNVLSIAVIADPSPKHNVGFLLRIEGSGASVRVLETSKESSLDSNELRELFRQRNMPFDSEELKAMAKRE